MALNDKAPGGNRGPGHTTTSGAHSTCQRCGRPYDLGPIHPVCMTREELHEWRNRPRSKPEKAEQKPKESKPESGERHLKVTSAANMKMRAATWTWNLRIPSGAITLLAGREGIGKSTIIAHLVAQMTQGTLNGIHYGTPRGVAVCASEDDWECVILPRLTAAGADLDYVFRIEVVEDGALATLSLPADTVRLAETCKERGISLVICDPLMSLIHGRLDTHKDRDVRQALEPLVNFAKETGVAVLGLIHVNKTSTSDPLNSIMGSRAFAAVARSVLFCIEDPEAEGDNAYLFGHVKSNLGPKQGTLTYHIVEEKVSDEANMFSEKIVTSKVVWDGNDSRTIRDAMEIPQGERPVGDTAARIAMWAVEQGRTVSAKEVQEAFPDIQAKTVTRNLTRMVKRGTLIQVMYGHYSAPRKSKEAA